MSEIMVLNGVCAGTIFVLPDIPTVLGRSPESHLQIGDPWISSMHAMFERRGEEVWVVDLDSRNGTFIGDERVSEARLEDGSIVRFGRTQVRFTTRSTWAAPPRTPPEERARPEGPRETIRSDGTISSRAPLPARVAEPDPYALALRPVVVLRASLHATSLDTGADAGERIRTALDAVTRAALDEGGAVGRLASVGVIALFGLTGASGQDAVRALQAARAGCTAVRGLGGFDLRAAVDAGPILAGDAGGPTGHELAALGAAADRAERLAGAAAPGEILVGPGAANAIDLAGLTRVETREVGGLPVDVVLADG
ncbi:MAG TPA: FHA domain-containing protein [Anaeromyxobacter sp.]|nr:FHA domain-containing protein [Anaeromyxobacter sp.]